MAISRKATLRPVPASGVPIYQLRIELQHLKPSIWRSVLVPGSIKLSKLHIVVLRTMGWTGGHLHDFIIGEMHYGQPDTDFPQSPPVLRDDRYTLAKSLGALKTFRYLYDFGDGWEHKVRIDSCRRIQLCACRCAWLVRTLARLKMLEARRATSTSSRLFQIRVTTNTKPCWNGAAGLSIHTPST
jgi:hypothetical protein